MKVSETKYNKLHTSIGLTIEEAKAYVNRVVNTTLVKANWEIGRRNIPDIRKFYLAYPVWQTVSARPGWCPYIVLRGITDRIARKFYGKQADQIKFSYRNISFIYPIKTFTKKKLKQ